MVARSASRHGEEGEASIEFLGVVMVILIPVFYLIMTLGTLQGAVFATEATARNAARIVADDPHRVDAARIQGQLTFADYGIESAPDMTFTCLDGICQPGRGRIQVAVDTVVPLPFLPEWLGVNLAIPIHADVAMPVSGVTVD